MPVEAEHAAERLEPEGIGQPPQHLLGPAVRHDVRRDLAGQASHAAEQPGRCLASMQREIGEASVTGHTEICSRDLFFSLHVETLDVPRLPLDKLSAHARVGEPDSPVRRHWRLTIEDVNSGKRDGTFRVRSGGLRARIGRSGHQDGVDGNCGACKGLAPLCRTASRRVYTSGALRPRTQVDRSTIN